MRFSQLKTFHGVAKWGGFSKAAQKLNISQPAVSDHIKNLEETYGLQLRSNVAKMHPKTCIEYLK